MKTCRALAATERLSAKFTLSVAAPTFDAAPVAARSEERRADHGTTTIVGGYFDLEFFIAQIDAAGPHVILSENTLCRKTACSSQNNMKKCENLAKFGE